MPQPSSSGQWITSILKGIPHVTVYLDDIVVTGTTEAEHLKNLEMVLQCLQEAGVRLQKEKCVFHTPQIEYLGHLIDADGLHPSPSKIRAVTETPPPTNLTELRAFLSLVNYYRKFIPNISSELCPLYSLL